MKWHILAGWSVFVHKPEYHKYYILTKEQFSNKMTEIAQKKQQK